MADVRIQWKKIYKVLVWFLAHSRLLKKGKEKQMAVSISYTGIY